MQEWNPVTGDDYSVGPDQPSGGITVPGRQARLIGPFTWTASQGTGNLHRCPLAAITSDSQGAPQNADGTLPEGYLSNQVAQRNVQFEDCSWQLPSTQQPGTVKITLTVNGAQPQLAGLANDIRVVFEDPNGIWNAGWNPPPSNNYTSTYDGTTGKTTVRLGTSPVNLTARIAANASPVATVTITEVQETTSVVFNASLTPDHADGSTQPIKLNGDTCTYIYEIIQ
jgi:hypothetical protein